MRIIIIILILIFLIGCTNEAPSVERTCEEACIDAGFSGSVCHESAAKFKVYTYKDEQGMEIPYDEFTKTPPYIAHIMAGSPNFDVCGMDAYVFVGSVGTVGGMDELVEFSDCNNKGSRWNACCCA